VGDSEFNDEIDMLMEDIEDAVEDSGVDIDYETANGILTLTFENGTAVIISRQVAMSQVWVAAKSGGFHFDRQGDLWQCSTRDETLGQLLDRTCSEQSGEMVALGLSC